jgi:hypothetical protein
MTKIDYALILHKRIRQKEKEIIRLYDEFGSYIRNFKDDPDKKADSDYFLFFERSQVIDSLHESDLEDMENRKWERIRKAREK